MVVHFGLFILLSIICATAQRVCIPDSKTIQPNFSPIKFAGKWYEIAWMIYPWDIINGMFKKTKTFRLQENGDFLLEVAGRRPFYRPVECDARNVSLPKTCFGSHRRPDRSYGRRYKDGCPPGHYVQTVPPWGVDNPARLQVPFKVYETDYSQYALIYDCIIFNLDGSCGLPNCWILSRTETLPEKINRRLNYIIEKRLCLKRSEFFVANEGERC